MSKKTNLSAAVNADAASFNDNNNIFDERICKIITNQARKMIKLGAFPEHMQNDLEQELSLILVAEVHKFAPDKSNFYTFTKMVLCNRAKNLIDKSVRVNPDIEIWSLDKSTIVDGQAFKSDNEDGETLISIVDADTVNIAMGRQTRPEFESRELRESIQYALTQLSSELQTICIEILKGESIKSLAVRYNISRPGFRKKYISKIREVFIEAGLGDFVGRYDDAK